MSVEFTGILNLERNVVGFLEQPRRQSSGGILVTPVVIPVL